MFIALGYGALMTHSSLEGSIGHPEAEVDTVSMVQEQLLDELSVVVKPPVREPPVLQRSSTNLVDLLEGKDENQCWAHSSHCHQLQVSYIPSEDVELNRRHFRRVSELRCLEVLHWESSSEGV